MRPLVRTAAEALLTVALVCASDSGFCAEPSLLNSNPDLQAHMPFSSSLDAEAGTVTLEDGTVVDKDRIGEDFDFEIGSTCRDFPHWRLQTEAVFLWRGDDALADWTLDGDESADRGVGIGPRVVLACAVNPQSSWQAEYFSMLGMVGTARSNRAHSQVLPSSQNIFQQGDYFSINVPIAIISTYGSPIQYKTELHNAELNYYRSLNEFALLAGFRYLRLTEDFVEQHWQGQQTENNLFGGQIGVRWRRSRELRFWEVTGKAGVYGNDAQQTPRFKGDGLNLLPGATRHSGNVAFVGDLNASLGWRLTPVWSLRGGYNVIWIAGVALAPDQDFSLASDSVNTSGCILLHGLNVGLEANW